MKLAITSESTIDLTPDLIKEYDIKIVPFTVIFGEETKLDGEFDNNYIYDFVKRTNVLPRTSAVNQFQYEELFENTLKEYDEIIHIAFTSELSSAFRNATLAAERFNGKVHIVNTLSLSTGVGLLAIYARELDKQGKSVNEIVDLVKAHVTKLQLSFVIETVDYLRKGGRCSAMAAFGANFFHIRPEIVMREGKLFNDKKLRGPYAKVCEEYVDDVLAKNPNPCLDYAFITHSLNDLTIVEMAKQKMTARGFKKIYITYTGSTITSHCGPNTLGLVFFNN